MSLCVSVSEPMVGSGFRSELFFRIRIQNTNLYIATKFEDFFCGLNYFGRSEDQTHVLFTLLLYLYVELLQAPSNWTDDVPEIFRLKVAELYPVRLVVLSQQLDGGCPRDIPAQSCRALSCQVGWPSISVPCPCCIGIC